MNDKQKASSLLQFMEDEWDGKAIINALNPLLKDEDLAALYDKLQNDGVIREPEADDTPEEVREALEYVRENIDCVSIDVMRKMVTHNMEHRLPADTATPYVGKVQDLLEEYGDDNELPEGWWEEYGDIDDWLLKL